MAEESRFDFGAIARASAIIIVGTSIVGFAYPALVTLLLDPTSNHTGPAAGSIIFTWVFWGAAWGLTVWQGAWMLRAVHERIIDDMLVTSVLVAFVLLIVKVFIAILYGADKLFQGFDVGGALIVLVVALIGARANQF